MSLDDQRKKWGAQQIEHQKEWEKMEKRQSETMKENRQRICEEIEKERIALLQRKQRQQREEEKRLQD